MKRDDVQCIIADPPDNIGYNYSSYNDNLPPDIYFGWIESWLMDALRIAPIVWLSYNAKHVVEMNHLVYNIKKFRHPLHTPRQFIWRYTFGSQRSKDCTNGYRPIIRFLRNDAVIYPENILIESTRQKMGDPRAAEGGKIPDDVFDIPRVTGNSHERRSWHPTQHPDELVNRIIRFSTKLGDTVFDLFGGTGTVLRNCHRLDRNSITTEIDLDYCFHISEENNNCTIRKSI